MYMVSWDRVTWKSAAQIQGDRKGSWEEQALGQCWQRGINCRSDKPDTLDSSILKASSPDLSDIASLFSACSLACSLLAA